MRRPGRLTDYVACSRCGERLRWSRELMRFGLGGCNRCLDEIPPFRRVLLALVSCYSVALHEEWGDCGFSLHKRDIWLICTLFPCAASAMSTLKNWIDIIRNHPSWISSPLTSFAAVEDVSNLPLNPTFPRALMQGSIYHPRARGLMHCRTSSHDVQRMFERKSALPKEIWGENEKRKCFDNTSAHNKWSRE